MSLPPVWFTVPLLPGLESLRGIKKLHVSLIELLQSNTFHAKESYDFVHHGESSRLTIRSRRC